MTSFEPRRQRGYPIWEDSHGEVEVRFVGKGPDARRNDVLQAVAAGPNELAWLRQVHSARVLAARQGCAGRGDALISGQSGLALSVATADCVPVLIAGCRHVAAVHAGWRGIAQLILRKTLTQLPEDPGGLTAWTGPAIGPCCYEVAADVAARVCAATGVDVAIPGPRGRPHVDLAAAVRCQLAALGVADVRQVSRCTRCHPGELWSYRCHRNGSGRNLAFVWRRQA